MDGVKILDSLKFSNLLITKTKIIENKYLYLEYAPEIGGSILKFQYKSHLNNKDIFRPFANKRIDKYSAIHSGYFSTIPYFGRIKQKTFLFKGKYINLDKTHKLEKDTIHGEGWVNKWRVINIKNSSVNLEFIHNGKQSFPYKYKAQQEFILNENSLIIKVSIKNIDTYSYDCGIGFHPWFNLTKYSKIYSNTFNFVELNNNNKLIKKKLYKKNKFFFEISQTKIDKTFINWDGRSELILNNNLNIIINNKKNIKNLHIFSPKGKKFFCIEPTTNIANSFSFKKNNIDIHGLKKLKPNEKFEAIVSFDVII